MPSRSPIGSRLNVFGYHVSRSLGSPSGAGFHPARGIHKTSAGTSAIRAKDQAMGSDVETASRIQFTLTIMFHYLFPPLSIGLGTLMVFMEGTYLRTGDARYHAMTKFWSRVFAVNFAMGVATGLVMEFQFGTNWG